MLNAILFAAAVQNVDTKLNDVTFAELKKRQQNSDKLRANKLNFLKLKHKILLRLASVKFLFFKILVKSFLNSHFSVLNLLIISLSTLSKWICFPYVQKHI